MKAVSLLTSFLLQPLAPAMSFDAFIQHLILYPCSPSYYASRLSARKEGTPIQQRRQFVSRTLNIGTLSLLTFPFATSKVDAHETKPADRDCILLSLSSPKEISQYIKQNCNRGYLQSVKSTGYNFLYRGLSKEEEEAMEKNPSKKAIIVLSEPYDLLDPETYHSEEAAAYFQSLEDKLSVGGSSIKPSNAHIATTCPLEASKWGTAMSIWPLGERGVEFLWLKDGGVFWPPPHQTLMAQAFERNTNHTGLGRALQGDAWEVMFRSDSGFLAVPAGLDHELRNYLRCAD